MRTTVLKLLSLNWSHGTQRGLSGIYVLFQLPRPVKTIWDLFAAHWKGPIFSIIHTEKLY